jgi:hypothetical protein
MSREIDRPQPPSNPRHNLQRFDIFSKVYESSSRPELLTVLSWAARVERRPNFVFPPVGFPKQSQEDAVASSLISRMGIHCDLLII